MGLVASHLYRLAAEHDAFRNATASLAGLVIGDGIIHHLRIIQENPNVQASDIGRTVPTGPCPRLTPEVPARRINVVSRHLFKTFHVFGFPSRIKPDQFGGLHKFACRKHVQLSGHHRLHTGRPRIQYIHGTPGMRLISCDVPTQDVIISRHGIARRPLTGSVRSAEARFGTRLEVRLCVTEGAQSVPTVNPRLFLTQYFLFHPFQIGTGVIQPGMCERSL